MCAFYSQSTPSRETDNCFLKTRSDDRTHNPILKPNITLILILVYTEYLNYKVLLKYKEFLYSNTQNQMSIKEKML